MQTFTQYGPVLDVRGISLDFDRFHGQVALSRSIVFDSDYPTFRYHIWCTPLARSLSRWSSSSSVSRNIGSSSSRAILRLSLYLSPSGPGPASRSSYACCLSALVVTLGLFLWETKNFQTAMLLVLALSFATWLFATPSMNLTHALAWVLYRESSPWDLDHRYLSTLRWLSSRLA